MENIMECFIPGLKYGIIKNGGPQKLAFEFLDELLGNFPQPYKPYMHATF